MIWPFTIKRPAPSDDDVLDCSKVTPEEMRAMSERAEEALRKNLYTTQPMRFVTSPQRRTK